MHQPCTIGFCITGTIRMFLHHEVIFGHCMLVLCMVGMFACIREAGSCTRSAGRSLCTVCSSQLPVGGPAQLGIFLLYYGM